MLQGSTYDEVYRSFQWRIPELFNIGVDVCDKWAKNKHHLALIYVDSEGREQKFTFWELKNLSNQLANTLKEHGVGGGDRIGILLPQCPETVISHIAAYKLGAIAVPLLVLFGPLAIEHRLANSEAKVVITDMANLFKIFEIKEELPALKLVLVVGSEGGKGVLDFWCNIEKGSREFSAAATRSDDPALIVYTSGTTGPPKGALHAHRLLLGELPAVEFCQDFFPQEGDMFWTPLDWAYMGGSYNSLFPCLHYGVPVLAYRKRKFDPEEAFQIIAKYGVNVIFTVATVLRMMLLAVENPREKFDLQLRSITVGGETMGKDLYEMGNKALGLQFTENYGQTECDYNIGNCPRIMEIIPGSMGRAIPGHIAEIINEGGEVLKPGTFGEIAIKAPDPVMFLGYWKDLDATKAKYVGEWFRTGDYGMKDDNGYFWFTGRKDDLIESGGYRIGPGEVEDVLMKHDAVSLVAVIGVPDTVRGEIVKAFIVPKEGIVADKDLETSIKEFVKTKLEAHAYPREIEFLKEMPLTNTGKIMKKDLRERNKEKRASREERDNNEN